MSTHNTTLTFESFANDSSNFTFYYEPWIYSCAANPDWQTNGFSCMFDAITSHFDVPSRLMWSFWCSVCLFLWIFTTYSTYKLFKNYREYKHKVAINSGVDMRAPTKLANKKKLYILITFTAICECIFLVDLSLMSPFWLSKNLESFWHGWCCRNISMNDVFHCGYSFGVFMSGICGTGIISCYYFRLKLIFDESMFAVGIKENITMCILVIIDLSLTISDVYEDWYHIENNDTTKIIRICTFSVYLCAISWIAYLLGSKFWKMAVLLQTNVNIAVNSRSRVTSTISVISIITTIMLMLLKKIIIIIVLKTVT